MTSPSNSQTVRLDRSHAGELRLELEGVQLAVVAGPDTGLRRTFALPLIRVGTAEDNDFVLRAPGVSRRHLEIQVSAEGIRVADLGSTNGTWIGETRVDGALVPDGAVIQAGEARIEVRHRTERRASATGKKEGLGGLVGSSSVMQELYGLLQAVAPTAVSVLLRGESGTGKEEAARILHDLSVRSGPLVVFDGASTSPELLQSQLFGHKKGAFTGAEKDREGAFRAAQNGTLFIDELGELPLEAQPRLLRTLERREVTPLGSDTPVAVDVRVVAATHRDLPAMVREGTFREDLYHRLAVFPLDLPSLREHPDDIATISAALLEKVGTSASLSNEALAVLQRSSWPGNVRALRNTLERASIIAQGGQIGPQHLVLPQDTRAQTSNTPVAAAPPAEVLPLETLAQAERRLIEAALARTATQKEAAAVLGISVATLRRRVTEYRQQEKPDQ